MNFNQKLVFFSISRCYGLCKKGIQFGFPQNVSQMALIFIGFQILEVSREKEQNYFLPSLCSWFFWYLCPGVVYLKSTETCVQIYVPQRVYLICFRSSSHLGKIILWRVSYEWPLRCVAVFFSKKVKFWKFCFSGFFFSNYWVGSVNINNCVFEVKLWLNLSGRS